MIKQLRTEIMLRSKLNKRFIRNGTKELLHGTYNDWFDFKRQTDRRLNIPYADIISFDFRFADEDSKKIYLD